MYGVVLATHLLAATVWTGGHLVLALTVLPRVLKEKSVPELLRFESAYERIGIPALILQVVTGIWLSYRLLPGVGQWFTLGTEASRLIALKLILLGVTAAFAADARLRLIPRLSEERLGSLAWHIVPVTVISVLFVIVAVLFRTGGLS